MGSYREKNKEISTEKEQSESWEMALIIHVPQFFFLKQIFILR